ncbi:pyridoxamine 5'-phosphate oxidase family protein [Microbacterium sp. NPDC086615]|jgi:uncharacterized protein YhbP (UPF0306 family)|uniref:pyridoxamine 5'-phosphate oxidase family protein n=1 Tax=Microbacterium sp. NPDC086615 TaxID=3154865 RepID=UPI003446C368|nr:non-ribosomal peptide synthetase [Microbacterium sp.]
MTSLEQRAAAILASQRFVVIGTADTDGPWTAAAQYRLVPRGLYVESDRGSRHARAIAASGVASGVVYDSSAALTDADGVQFSFRAAEVDAEAAAVRGVLGARLPRDATARGELEAEVTAVLAVPTKRLYTLDVERAYVFDRDAWRTRGTDARIEVDAAEMWAALAWGCPGTSSPGGVGAATPGLSSALVVTGPKPGADARRHRERRPPPRWLR